MKALQVAGELRRLRGQSCRAGSAISRRGLVRSSRRLRGRRAARAPLPGLRNGRGSAWGQAAPKEQGWLLLNQVDSAPRGHVSGRFWCRSSGDGTTGSTWVKTGDAAQRPPFHGGPIRDVHVAGLEKPLRTLHPGQPLPPGPPLPLASRGHRPGGHALRRVPPL